MNNFKSSRLYLGLIVLALFSFYLWRQIVLPQFTGDEKEIAVNRGDNFLEIAHNLKLAGIIKNRLSFILAAIYRGSFLVLKAGQYVFEPGLNLHQIIAKIEKGDAIFGSNETVVTIPEGFTLADIVKRLEEAGFDDAGVIIKMRADSFVGKFPWLGKIDLERETLEGFLFPDTYRLPKDASLEEVVERMLKRFESKTNALRNSASISRRDFYDILTMASILEKEVPPADMPLAAGVLWKRLELGMPLQADATLVYDLGRPIKRSDIVELNSSYNSYKYTGLPPTPIANPGLVALNAALYFQKSNYLYYLSRSADKITVFSETLEQHNLAKAKYLNY